MVETFDVEKWKTEYPVDYTKAVEILKNIDHPIAVDIALQQLVAVYKMYIPNTLFKYYSFNNDEELNSAKIETLRKGKIYLSDPKDFNDPFDEKGYFYKSDKLAEIERLKHVNGKIIDDFSSYMRSTSLSGNDYNSMPMWAHYSNNHNGYCVAYDMKSPQNKNLYACTFPIQYTNNRIDITDQIFDFTKTACDLLEENLKNGIKETVLSDIRIPVLISFLGNIKHESWSYEHEFRCSVGAKYRDSSYIEAIPNEIYIGLNCNEKNKKELIKVAKQYDIPIYEMSYQEETPAFMLKHTEIRY